MSYVKTTNGTPSAYPFNDDQLKKAHPSTSFPRTLTNEIRAEYGVYPVQVASPPMVDGSLYSVEQRSMPELVDGTWTTVWDTVELSEEETSAIVARRRADTSVTMRQCRLILLEDGKLDDVEAAIAAMGDEERAAAEIEWEYATVVKRVSDFADTISAAIVYDDDKMDEMFARASSV